MTREQAKNIKTGDRVSLGGKPGTVDYCDNDIFLFVFDAEDDFFGESTTVDKDFNYYRLEFL